MGTKDTIDETQTLSQNLGHKLAVVQVLHRT